jgi:hypothetical protein
MKDPAALLYIDKWIVATMEMKADCRAYYMDLILFQFDKGSLPNDIEELANICRVRVSEYENFKQVFEQVLKHKFELNEIGRLENFFAKEIIQSRKLFIDKRSNAGKMSYVIRYAYKNLKVNKEKIKYIKDNINISEIDLKNEQVLKQELEHLIELYINKDEDEDKNKKEPKKIPEFSEFKSYALENKPNVSLIDLELKYKAWVANNWADGFDKKIKNWKSKLLQTLPHLKESDKKQSIEIIPVRNYD